MQITVTFNSLEEVNEFASRVWIAGLTEEKKPLTKEELNKTAMKAEEIINAAEAEKKAKKEEAKKSSPKEEKPAEEPQEEQTEAPAAAEDDISESDLKILLSKKLKAGKKAKVKELFEGYGVDSLSGLIEKHPDKIAEAYHKAEGI